MTNEQIENEATSYVGDILGLDGNANAERAFKAGASWRINSVWHDQNKNLKNENSLLQRIVMII